jgi:hypothetical protein
MGQMFGPYLGGLDAFHADGRGIGFDEQALEGKRGRSAANPTRSTPGHSTPDAHHESAPDEKLRLFERAAKCVQGAAQSSKALDHFPEFSHCPTAMQRDRQIESDS